MSHSVFEVEGQELTVRKAPADTTRVIKVDRLLCRGRHLSFTVPNGDMYSTRISSGSWYIGKRWQLKDLDLIEDAIILGVIDRAKINLRALKKLKEEQAQQREKGWAASHFFDNAKALGIRLSKSQLKVVDRYRGRES